MVYNTTFSLTTHDLEKEEPILLFSQSIPTPVKTIFLSNIDQAVTFPVETVFFYDVPPNKTFPSSTIDIADKVKKSVSEMLLGPYYFMAGRLNFNVDTKRMELICNNDGVIFVNAKSRISIKDLGNLSQPNPSFSNLIHRPGLYKSLAETAVFTIQVTRFECGGFSLGFMTNHAILDGKSASDMFHNLASICRGEGLKTQFINTDRTCIKARIPPQIQYPHKEYVKLAKTSSLPSSFTSQKRTSPSPLIFSDKYTHQLFPFSPKMLTLLKEKAMIKCSTFEAIVAHIWRARTKAVFDEENYDQDSTVLFAVDIRGRITPPLLDSFVGNAVITAFATARAQDLIQKPLCFGVEMVRKGRERVGNDYIRSVIDWLEVYKGIPASCDGSFYVSAWWKLPFKEVDFGYGKPKHAGPIVSGNDEFILLLADEINCDEGNGMGINVWIGLEKEKMERFVSSVFEI